MTLSFSIPGRSKSLNKGRNWPARSGAESDRAASEKRQRRQALATYLPYHDFLDGVVPQIDGRVSIYLRLAPLAADALTVAELNGVCASMHKLLANAPDDIELQFIYRQTHATPHDIGLAYGEARESRDSDLAGFARSRREHLEHLATSGELFETRYYLVITFSPSPAWYVENSTLATARWYDKLTAAFSTDGKLFHKRCRAEHEAMLADVVRQADGLKRDLEAFGVRATRMTDDEAFTLIYEHLNPTRRGDGGRAAATDYRYAPDVPEFYDEYPEARPLSPREQLVDSTVIHKDTHLSVDGLHVRAMRLKQLPLQSAPGMIETITSSLSFPFTLSVNVRVPKRADELAKLRRRMRMQASIGSATIGQIKPDTTDAEVAYRQLKNLVVQAIESDERAVYFGATMTFEASSLGEIDDYTNQVRTAARSMQLAEMIFDRHGARDVWLASAPGNSRRDYWKLWTTGRAVSTMLPLLGCWRGTRGRPFMVYPNRKGELVRLDPMRLPTPHFGIIGAPGSGKSVLLTDLILNHMQDPEALCYVVDSTGAESSSTSEIGVGQSAGGLQRLSAMLKGQFVLCDLTTMPNMNPLAIRPRPGDIDDGIECTEDGIPFMSLASSARFIETLALEPGEEALGKEYLNLIMYVLQRVLFNHQDPSDPPIMRNFLEELSSFTGEWEHAKVLFLRLLSSGDENNPIGRYLNRRDSVFDPAARMTVFDMHGVDKYSEYKSAVMMLVTTFLDRQVIRASNARRRKLILYDEAGRYLNTAMGDHMAHFAAVLRKRNAVIGFATQSLVDVTENTAGTRLLHNCGSLFILKIHSGLEEFCRQFNLTRKDAEIIASLSTTAFAGEMTACREAYLKVNDFRSVVRINLDDPMYYLSTSHPPDVRLLHILTKLFGVPGRDIGHYEFYRKVAEAVPHRSAASEMDLDRFEEQVDEKVRNTRRTSAA